MRLTTLNIKGFKSFPDKTSIHFNNNITGVVGPNGSGKSNIVDAIRWVLGEQKTSSLRSEKMDNLIFNGSKQRKSSGMAEVSLTFENTRGVIPSEFKEVTITRILHRDGESEYRINNVACRLKDITGLFMDTGVASDSYAIIELKMIDEILNDRENSRRRLFEQAAGISKYKIRKKETLNKLQLTDADLARVEDLLFEIGNNLKTLESQARKAKRYQQLKEEHKNLSLELARMQVVRQRESFKEIEAQKQEQEDKRLELETKITQLEAQLEKEKLELIEKEINLTSRQKELNELIAGITKKENEKSLANEQVRFLLERTVQLKKQADESEQGIVRLTTQLTQVNERRTAQNVTLEEAAKDLEVKKEEVASIRTQNDDLRKQLDTSRDTNQGLERQVHDFEKKIAINTSEKENLGKSIEQNSVKNSELEAQLGQLREQASVIVSENETKSAELNALTIAEEKLQKDLESASVKLKESEQLLSKESRKLDSKKNEYNLNKSLVDNLEGFPESIKFLKKNSPKAKEAQLLSDVIYSPEEYRTAIENFLEPFLNYFVVEDLKEAYESINLLSDASIGRANFFALNRFKDYAQKQTRDIPDAIPALSIVEVDDKYKMLASFLLDNVYLLPEEKFNTGLNGSGNENVILLSSNGKYIRTGYSLSGGALGLFEGMRLGRIKNLDKLKNEIEKLEKQVKSLEGETAQLQQSIAQMKASSRQRDIQAVREQLSRIGQQSASIHTKIENFQSFVEENLKRNAAIKTRMEQLEQDNLQLKQNLDELLASKLASGEIHDQLLKNYNTVSELLSKVNAEYNEKNILFQGCVLNPSNLWNVRK